MNKKISVQRLSLVLIAGVLAAHLLLICTTRLYPFLDMPNHLALATICRFFDDPGTSFSEFYTLDVFLKPNVLHLLFCSSKIFPSVEVANRIFYCLYLVLFVAGSFLIIRGINGNRWYLLLVPLLFYNCNVSYGFVGCTIGIPAVLLVLYCMLRDAQGAEAGNMLALTVILAALFFMHALMAVFALFVFTCWVLWHYRCKLHKACSRLVCALPCAGLILSWWLRDSAEYTDKGILPALSTYYLNDYLQKYYLRAGFLVHDNFRFWGGTVGYAVALAFSLLIVAGAVMPLLQNRLKGFRPVLPDASIKPIFVFFVCAAVCELVFPDALPGYSFLFERFSVFVMLGFIFLGSVFSARKSIRCFPALVVVACLIHFCIWADCMRSFNNENKEFTAGFLNTTPSCRTLAGLIYDYRFRAVSLYDNFADYFIAWNKGIATSRTIDERSFPVGRAVDATVLPPYLEWVGKHGTYDGRYENIDCILVRGEVPAKDRAFFEGYKLTRTAGAWKLFQKCGNNN